MDNSQNAHEVGKKSKFHGGKLEFLDLLHFEISRKSDQKT